jgi:hypothetical protein
MLPLVARVLLRSALDQLHLIRVCTSRAAASFHPRGRRLPDAICHALVTRFGHRTKYLAPGPGHVRIANIARGVGTRGERFVQLTVSDEATDGLHQGGQASNDNAHHLLDSAPGKDRDAAVGLQSEVFKSA